jgi:hypothetical protein
MRRNIALPVFLAALLTVTLFAAIYYGMSSSRSEAGQVDVFVGVDVAHDNVTSLKARVDEVKDYTNFFVIGSSGITTNRDKLDDVCQYLYDSGLHFTTYTHTVVNSTLTEFNQTVQSDWINTAKQKWNGKFWCLYPYDEPGGHQIDRDEPYMIVPNPSGNYSDVADKYVETLSNIYLSEFKAYNMPLLTSDYALYEFDYKAGYDVVLAEYAWNHSRPLNTALCRGAATMHDKEWGVMITYTYDAPPYLASGDEIYQDMVTAYENGAKYIIVFDYAKDKDTNITHGILQPEHLEALKNFWQYSKEHPRTPSPASDRTAYVLPAGYGYGFRGPNCSLWGLPTPDNNSVTIWNDLNTLLNQNQPNADIIYEDTLEYGANAYRELVFWNGTTITK